MKMKINKTIQVILILFSFLASSCSRDNGKDITTFIEQYIQTVSHEHVRYKKNITKNMTDYYMDYEHKEKAEMPEFLEIGPFRNNILVIDGYKIQKIEKRNDIDIGIKKCEFIFDVDVQFEIVSENGEPVTKTIIANYWVVSYKGRYYIYGDNFLQDIYILKKDIN